MKSREKGVVIDQPINNDFRALTIYATCFYNARINAVTFSRHNKSPLILRSVVNKETPSLELHKGINSSEITEITSTSKHILKYTRQRQDTGRVFSSFLILL